MSEENWKQKWQVALDSVGKDFSDGSIAWAAEKLEEGIIRRYCEPLEFGCAIHHDRSVAEALGYEDIVAPAFAFLRPAMWKPGEDTLFLDASRNAQPARSPINNPDPYPAPATEGFFATDIEMVWYRPVVVGERTGTRGRKLVSCELKETSVGRGAFMKFEYEIVSDRGDVVAKRLLGTYNFDPLPKIAVDEGRKSWE